MTTDIMASAPLRPAPWREQPRRSRRRSRPRQQHDRIADRIAWAALGVALLGLVVVAARAATAGAEPVGDSAIVAIRARDVLSGELPLVGMPAASTETGAHHPAPFLFDLLAVPVALLPDGTGLVVGMALLNAAAIAGMFLVARRVGGPGLAALAVVEAMALAWAMGSKVLVEPWHASAVLLPFLAFMLLAWGVACGDIALLPWAVGVGSFVVGTNLSYVVLVPVLLVFALVGAYVAGRDEPPWLPLGTAAATVVVLAVGWAHPLYEQLFGIGDGNVTRLVRAARRLGETSTLDWSEAPRVVAKILGLPLWWLRPTYSDALAWDPSGRGLPSSLVAVVALVGLLAQLTLFLRAVYRSGDRTMVTALAGALVLVVTALVTAKLTPAAPELGSTAVRMRWLWPVGTFLAFALAGSVLRFVVRLKPGWLRWLVLWAAGGTAWLVGFTIPVSNQGTVASDAATGLARDLARDLPVAELPSPLLVDCRERVGEPYCEAVMAELQRRDVDFVVPEAGRPGLGDGRLWDGTNAAARLLVITGDGPVDQPPGALLVTRREGQGTDERPTVAVFIEAI
jgi:hypothetical protein